MESATGTDVRELTIDREFAGLCPPLKPEELNLLEASLERDGCRDPIVVWANNQDTIIDGHNRYRFCRKFGAAFKTKAVVLEDRNAVRNWIIDNQLARRNVTEEQKAYLRGQRYITEKRAQGGTGANQHKSHEQSVQNDQSANTADMLAAEYKVAPMTIRRDAQYAEAIDTIAKNAGDKAKAAILSGDLNITKKDVMNLSTLSPSVQKKAVQGGVDAVKQATSAIKERHYQTLAMKTVRGEKFSGPADDAAVEYKSLACDALDALALLRKAVLSLDESTLNSGAWINTKAILSAITDMRRQIKDGAPHENCPDCKGPGCGKCKQCGFLNKGAFDKWSKS